MNRSLVLILTVTIGTASWFGYSGYKSSEADARRQSLRHSVCQRMADIRQTSEAGISACAEDLEVYKTQLNAVMTSRLPAMRNWLNSEIAKVNAASDHLEISNFRAINATAFSSIFEPFALDPAMNHNAKLDKTRVKVRGILVSDYEDPEMPDTLPSLSFTDNNNKEGAVGFGIDMNPVVYDTMSTSIELACFIVAEVDGGCRGEIFVVNQQTLLGDQPYVVGLEMEEFSDEQVIAYLSKFYMPSLVEGDSNHDETRMQRILKDFQVN